MRYRLQYDRMALVTMDATASLGIVFGAVTFQTNFCEGAFAQSREN
jgi:hypothetical protein